MAREIKRWRRRIVSFIHIFESAAYYLVKTLITIFWVASLVWAGFILVGIVVMPNSLFAITKFTWWEPFVLVGPALGAYFSGKLYVLLQDKKPMRHLSTTEIEDDYDKILVRRVEPEI